MSNWVNPTADLHVPPGGEFLSMIANGRPRSVPHSGVDFSRWPGNDVVSIGYGTVAAVGAGNREGSWGNHIWIDHGPDGGEPDGPNVPHIFSGYAHMLAAPPFNVGDRVEPGTVLGGIGSSGVPGPHLHFAMAVCTLARFASTVREMGSAARAYLIDPLEFLTQYATPLARRAVNARQIGPAGARRRQRPTVSDPTNFDPAQNYSPGSWVEWDGFVRSNLPGGGDDGDVIWLVKDGLYTKWTATVPVPGDGALRGISDLGTYVDPTPPVVVPEPQPNPEPTPVDPEPIPDPTEESPVTDPAPTPAPTTPEPPVPSLSDEQLAAILATAKLLGVSKPEQPIIPDRIAKPMWVILAILGITVPYVCGLTVLDWAQWGQPVATQFSGATVGWLGLIAATLGLSRYAKTKP